MYIRRFVMLSLFFLGIAAAQLVPAITATSSSDKTEIRLADGDFPPAECGLYDPCKVPVKS